MKSIRTALSFSALALIALSMAACSNEKDDVQNGGSPLIAYDGESAYTVEISGDELRISIEPVTQQDNEPSHLFTLELEGWDSQECKLYRINGDKQEEVPLMNLPLIQFEALPGDYLIIR